MKALELDFCRDAPASPWAGWLLLAVAVFFAGDLAISYQALHRSIAEHEGVLARLEGPAAEALRASSRRPAVSEEELGFARETIGRLAMPWSNLFGALESASAKDVSLLAVEPDREAGTVLIRAEGRDYASALAYVAELRRAKTLHGVHLVKHETRDGKGPYRLSFTVSAGWTFPREVAR